jgi:hypothetical protein
VRRSRARAVCSVITAGLCGALATAARGNGPILHEPIAPNPVEDLAMHAVRDGNLPAALLTSAGPVSAPDPQSLPSAADTHYGPASARDEFRPDRDARAIDSAYDDPFTPSTAPFKRMAAFDAVRSDYELYVRSTTLTAIPFGPGPRADDDAFYLDAVVDVSPGRRARIPSVGPGARIISGRLGVGPQSVGYSASRDGADNWYIEALAPRGHLSARLVLELAIARATFGGPVADASWSDLLPAFPLPANVAREAEQVCKAIGVSRRMRPREALTRLVDYFRGFSDSNEPVSHRASVYLDLALSKTGVCRHRAFAFMITALELGIPTRLAENEAHAWVEVHDGVGWRRIDLGGAGRLTANLEQEPRPSYRSPGDAFPWPLGSQRSDPSVPAPTQGGPAEVARVGPLAAPAPSETGPGAAPTAVGAGDSGPTTSPNASPSSVSLIVLDEGVRRGSALRARGEIRANGEPCPRVGVDVLLRNRETRRLTFLGTLAAGDDGSFVGSVVVPASTPVGDYDFIAKREGSGRCGPGQN